MSQEPTQEPTPNPSAVPEAIKLEESFSADAEYQHRSQITCGTCRLKSVCLPSSLHVEEVEQLNNIIQRSQRLKKGDYIYRAGEVFVSVYALRWGTVKAVNMTDGGREQIKGFYLAGEIVGGDGIASNHYTNSVVALEPADICEIPFSRMEKLSLRIPNLQRHFFQLLSREIADDQQMIALRSKNRAEERLAALLLNIVIRNSRCLTLVDSFRLPMPSVDIGNYLGLTVNTVGRVLSDFQRQGILVMDGEEISILDMKQLRLAANEGLF